MVDKIQFRNTTKITNLTSSNKRVLFIAFFGVPVTNTDGRIQNSTLKIETNFRTF